MEFDYITQGDCLTLMRTLPDSCIDLTVTSPPYDNLRKYNGFVWDFEVRQALFFMECGFNLHDTMIYQKDACPFPETNRYYPMFEYMFVFSKGKPKTVNLIADKPNKRYGEKIASSTQRRPDGKTVKVSANKTDPTRTVKKYGVRGNVWKYSPGYNKSTKDKYAYQHPAMFPEKLAADHILTWSNPGDIVLDPFLGSGTTAKMAVLNDRHYIGFELSSQYFDIACQRLDDAEKGKFFNQEVKVAKP